MKCWLCVLLGCLLCLSVAALPVSAETSTVMVKFPTTTTYPTTATTTAPPEDPSVLRELYEPETGLVAPPTVIQEVDDRLDLTALAKDGAPAQAAWFQVKSGYHLTVRLGQETAALSEVLAACDDRVIPILQVADEATATQLMTVLTSLDVEDVIVASDSVAALAALGRDNDFIYRALIADDADPAATLKKARDGNASICVLEETDRETAEYFQKRFLSVFLRSTGHTDRDRVKAAMGCGANGVTVSEPEAAYSQYRAVTAVTYVRRPFLYSAMGSSGAPRGSLEDVKQRLAADVDGVSCVMCMVGERLVLCNATGCVFGAPVQEEHPAHQQTELAAAFAELKKHPDKMMLLDMHIYAPAAVETYGVLDQLLLRGNSLAVFQTAARAEPRVGVVYGTALETYRDQPNGQGVDLIASMEIISRWISDCNVAASYEDTGFPGEMAAGLSRRGLSLCLDGVSGLSELRARARTGALMLVTDTPEHYAALQADLATLPAAYALPTSTTVATTTTAVSTEKPATSTTTGGTETTTATSTAAVTNADETGTGTADTTSTATAVPSPAVTEDTTLPWGIPAALVGTALLMAILWWYFSRRRG